MINVSFVGCGGMAAHYLGVYRELDWVRIKGGAPTPLEANAAAMGTPAQ